MVGQAVTERGFMAEVLAELRAVRRELRELRAVVTATGEPPAGGLVTATELAELLGVHRSYIYEHADDLGAVRLGDGPRARLRFDAARAVAAHKAHKVDADTPPAPSPPAAARRTPGTDRPPARFEPIRAPEAA